MNIQNFKIAFRSLLKNKFPSGINIIGLTVAITVSVLIFSFVRKEYTTDTFFPGYENIYGLKLNKGASISQPIVNLFIDDIPEIESITHYHEEWAPQVYLKSEQHSKFKIGKLMIADSSFFKVFQFESLWGNPQDALNSSNKIVLTQALAEKIFGDQNPVGKSIGFQTTYLENETVEIAAVIKNIPFNSSWDFEGVLSMPTNYNIGWYNSVRKQWGSHNYNACIKTIAGANKAELEAKLNTIFNEKETEGYGREYNLSCQPYREIYFNAPDFSNQKHGNKFTLSVVNIVGVLILLLACFNYINLVTAQRGKRNKTIGIAKTLGSTKAKIVQLVSAESLIILLMVAVLVGGVIRLLIPELNNLIGSNFSYSNIISGWSIVLIAGIFITTFILTGIVPGLLFCKQKTTFLLKPTVQKRGKNYTRNGFLVFQFVISIALIASVITINRQSAYINNFNTGFEQENIIYASTSNNIMKHIDGFSNELKNAQGVTDWTFAEQNLGFVDQNWGMQMNIKGETKTVSFAKMNVSSNFFDFFGIDLLKGETFSENGNAKKEFILNQRAFSEFGISNLSDGRMMISDDASKGKIIAEVADFNFESVHAPIRPIGFMHAGKADEVIYIKIKGNNYTNFQETVASIETTWNKFSPNFPFEFKFLDDSWNSLYAKDQQFMHIMSYTTILSILLSCLGLIGLTFFIIENYTKEIGIRKVNGARVFEVMALLNKDFIKWVAIAFVLATPIAWYAMNKWLENFAYKTSLSWWIFALAGALALGIALLTVSWQSWRAATRNPVEALRYE
jgi:putative ABC transport system permease protein